MLNFKTKKKIILLPYLIISLTTVLVWSFLDWLLFIKLNIFPLDEGIRTILIPLILSIISLNIWLKNGIDSLKMKTKGNKIIYYFIPTVAIVGLSFFLQQYVILATSKVTDLSFISQITQKEPTKFYNLKNFYLDKNNFSIQKRFEGSARHGNSLYINLYITVPILNTAKDTSGSNCVAWYGVQYSTTVRGFLSDHKVKQTWTLGNIEITGVGIDTIENSAEYKKFFKESMAQFDTLNLNQFKYLVRYSETEGDYDNYALGTRDNSRSLMGDYKNYVSAIKNNSKYNTKSDVILLPQNESLSQRAKHNLLIALAIFGAVSLLFLIVVDSTPLKSEAEEIK